MKQSIKPQGLLPCVKDGEKDEDGAEHKTTRTILITYYNGLCALFVASRYVGA